MPIERRKSLIEVSLAGNGKCGLKLCDRFPRSSERGLIEASRVFSMGA